MEIAEPKTCDNCQAQADLIARQAEKMADQDEALCAAIDDVADLRATVTDNVETMAQVIKERDISNEARYVLSTALGRLAGEASWGWGKTILAVQQLKAELARARAIPCDNCIHLGALLTHQEWVTKEAYKQREYGAGEEVARLKTELAKAEERVAELDGQIVALAAPDETEA